MTMVIRLVPIATAVFLAVVSGPAYARFGGALLGGRAGANRRPTELHVPTRPKASVIRSMARVPLHNRH